MIEKFGLWSSLVNSLCASCPKIMAAAAHYRHSPSLELAPSMKILFLFLLMTSIMLASHYGSSRTAVQRLPAG